MEEGKKMHKNIKIKCRKKGSCLTSTVMMMILMIIIIMYTFLFLCSLFNLNFLCAFIHILFDCLSLSHTHTHFSLSMYEILVENLFQLNSFRLFSLLTNQFMHEFHLMHTIQCTQLQINHFICFVRILCNKEECMEIKMNFLVIIKST